MSRKLTEGKKKLVAGSQRYKCANKKDSNLPGLQNYNCPLWHNNDGSFDESGYEIDHKIEYSLTEDDSYENLQALCAMCHKYKTKKFIIDKVERTPKIKVDKKKQEVEKVKIEFFETPIDVNEFSQAEFNSAVNHKRGLIIGLIKLIYFSDHSRYHNVYTTTKNVKGLATVYTDEGIETKSSGECAAIMLSRLRIYVKSVKEVHKIEVYERDLDMMINNVKNYAGYEKMSRIDEFIHTLREIQLLMYDNRQKVMKSWKRM